MKEQNLVLRSLSLAYKTMATGGEHYQKNMNNKGKDNVLLLEQKKKKEKNES